MSTEKTAVIKVYVKGEAIGTVWGDANVVFDPQGNEVYKHTELLMKDVISMINETRVGKGLEAYRPSQLVGAQMLICYT